MNIGTLTGRIELDDAFSSGLDLTIHKIEKMGASFTRAGTVLSVGITAPLVAAAGASLKFSADFDASMTRLVSIAGVSQEELAGVKQHILDLAPAVGIGPQALADAMTKVSSTVSDTKTALEILDIAAQGTKAGFGETVDVAGALTSVINSYGAENLSAARAADILAQAVKEGGAEAKELAPTLANVVPFAAQLGVSFEEVAANIATMTKLGVPTAEAVTSLTSVFTALTKESQQGTDALAAMGMSYAGIREQIAEKGLAAALTDLSTKFKGNETAMVDVFGRIEAVKNIMGTAGAQAETYASVLGKIQRSSDSANGAMQDMADAMSGTQVQTWKELRATVETLAIKLGDSLAPAMGRVLDAARPVLDWVVSAVDAFSKLPQPIQTTAFAIVGLVAAIGPLLFTLGTLISSVTAVGGAFGATGITMAGLVGATGPLVLVTAAFAGIGVVVKKYLDLLDDLERAQGPKKQINELTQQARELEKSLKPKLDMGVWEAVVPPLQEIGRAAKGAKTATKELTDEQKQAAKEMKQAQQEIEMSMIPVTAAQRAQIIEWDRLGVSSGTAAKALGVSEIAAGRVLESMKLLNTEIPTVYAGMAKFEDLAPWSAVHSGLTQVIADHDVVLGQLDEFKSRFKGELFPDWTQSIKGLQAALASSGIFAEGAQKSPIGIVSNLISGVPAAIQAAIQGGGSKLQAAGSAIGAQLFGAGSSLTKTMTSGISKLFGTSGLMGQIGSALGSAIPIVGSLIGPALQGLTKFFGTAGRDAVRSYAEGMGGFDAVHAKLGKMGAAGEQLWITLTQGVGRNNAEQAKAAIETVSRAIEEHEAKVAALIDQYSALPMRMQSITEVSPALQAALDAAIDATDAEGYATALRDINLAIDEQNAKANFLNSTMEKYGLTWVDLGEKARAAHVATEAASIEKEFRVLLEAGVDVNNIMRHMGDNLSDFVLQAVKSGTEVPESFKDVIQTAIDAGELYSVSTAELKRMREEAEKLGQPFDENKYKIDAIEQSGVKFGITMETATQNIATAIERLITLLEQRLGPAITSIPDPEVTVRVGYDYEKFDPRGGYEEPDYRAGGGVVYAAGGARIIPFPGRPRGTDVVPTWTTPGERVLTVAQNTMYERGMAGGRGDIIIQVDGREIARATVQHLPDEIERQMGRVG